ncbi:putative phospholipase B-like 2 [Oppia nitens]|uniref:putative phospholipase B-like 2 n=1 Tax=Oppia nitens TaxID=1686743 RepID=UPI0023DBCA92|nr:putative phospholipase B-like 2 [Oppia nitens]
MSLKLFVSILLLLTTLFNVVYNTKVVKYIDLKGNLKNVTQKVDNLTDCAVWAVYDQNINTTGWAQLAIHTNGSLEDSQQAYYSGLIEGQLTADLIELHWHNNVEHYCDNQSDYCSKLFAFVAKNVDFMKSQIANLAKTDVYWRQIELSLIQITGLEDGYREARYNIKPRGGVRLDVNITGLYLLNLFEELDELGQAIKGKSRTDDYFDGHCSAIIRVLPDGSDLYVAHNTWAGFSKMLRIVKNYNLNYRNISGTAVSFSGYPGVIYSVDDYYLINSGLTVLETTIGNFNDTLWSHVVADKIVFEFIRNLVANRMARSGQEWAKIFSKYNSGTYNNQFMVIDYNRFQKGKPVDQLASGVLWVVEQIPGLVESADVTHVLREQNYWPSYNVPYFQTIFDNSDYPTQVTKYGDFFTYNRTARALIFKRDVNKVIDMSSLYKLMRYNDFRNDPISRCNCSPPYTGEYAIAARSDLNDPNGRYPFGSLAFRSHGAIDVKMTNKEMFVKLEMIVNSGPTYDNQPPFQWSNTRITGVLHSGQPDSFQFPPVHVQWSPLSVNAINFNRCYDNI